MNCQCVGCNLPAKGETQEYCDYHSHLSVFIGADFKDGSKFATAYTQMNPLAYFIAECKSMGHMADNNGTVNRAGMIKILSRRFGRG